ncbi:Uncharacterised protein [uncultured archaeon]|nr:Uncharacterised protein [uncultured archaeon]
METRYENEFGTEIPEHIAKKGKEMGCYKPAYIYIDGEWMKHGKFPASNLNIKEKSQRFRDAASAEAHKVNLGDGWVVFKSPSGSGTRGSKKNDIW